MNAAAPVGTWAMHKDQGQTLVDYDYDLGTLLGRYGHWGWQFHAFPVRMIASVVWHDGHKQYTIRKAE